MPPPEHPRTAEVTRALPAAGTTGEVRGLPGTARTTARGVGR